jgi:hypothetical protein
MIAKVFLTLTLVISKSEFLHVCCWSAALAKSGPGALFDSPRYVMPGPAAQGLSVIVLF